MSTLKELRAIRIEKLNKIQKLGINPFPSKSRKDTNASEVTKNYEKLEGKKITVAGRLMSLRKHGKLTFSDLKDESGTVQLYVKESNLINPDRDLGEFIYEELHLLDVGDFVEAEGTVTKTQRGEISVEVFKLRILTKSLRPLPDTWEGITDPELIFRKRYLDLTLHSEKVEMFKRKSKFWDVNREFMKKKGFIEVETPVLEHVTGGADATPFTTHHNALDQQFFLRISTELYLKRLVGGGFEKVYTLGPNFRNEGLSDEHLQEYYQLEWYWAYADYNDMMEMIKEMFKHIALEVYGKTDFEKNGHKFDLGKDWQIIDYVKVLKERFGVDIFETSDETLFEITKKNGIKLDGAINRNRLIDNLWKVIRKEVSGPAFLINEPKFMSPLAKSKPKDPRLTERFHIVIAGSELGNGYSELNNPIDQLDRFKDQQSQRDLGDSEAQMMDTDFVEMLEYGMPPTAGYAHSERLFWFLEGITAREGTLFPQMRLKEDEINKEIFGVS